MAGRENLIIDAANLFSPALASRDKLGFIKYPLVPALLLCTIQCTVHGAKQFTGSRKVRPFAQDGNTDRSGQAAGESAQGPAGWTAVIRQFLAAGYTPAELYATTWGPADPAKAGNQVHSADYVQRVRAFLEAVLAYTGAEDLYVIAHSMGVTLAGRAILGGTFDGNPLGLPLTERVDTFVGIAGANQGLTACFFTPQFPTCSDHDGFFPGYAFFWGVTGLSDFFGELNAEPGFEGTHVYSIWSRADQVVGFGGLVYGKYTSRIPGQDGEKVYAGYPYGHFCVRDLSAHVQLEMVPDHLVP